MSSSLHRLNALPATALGIALIHAALLRAQDNPPAGEAAQPKIVTFTSQEDHRQMQEQLGIKKLRPGPSGNESAPNAANYDEALANPYPDLPPLLVCQNGTVVSTPEAWQTKRRPEIVELFEREVVGRIPSEVPKVTWKVLEETERMLGEIPVIETMLEGVVDNARC